MTLAGDRHIEYSFIEANMPKGPGRALDFGTGGGNLCLSAAFRGFEVEAIDLEEVDWPYIHFGMEFRRADFLKTDFPEKFDLIINCSSIEHVGLSGRYGIKEDNPDGDFLAMAKMKEALRPAGLMILTLPVGRDSVFPPLHRVYGRKRLPKLLSGYRVQKKEFWTKNKEGKWVLTTESAALDLKPKKDYYGLGCFILKK